MISYDEKNRIIKLDTPHTSYVMGITDEGYLGHVYYGDRLEETDLSYLMRTEEYPYTPGKLDREKLAFMDRFPMEYSGYGSGDFRGSCINIINDKGQEGVELLYKSHEIYDVKRELAGLPSMHGEADMCQSLDVVLEDRCIGVEVTLTYTVYVDVDGICRSVTVRNVGDSHLIIDRALSACLDIDEDMCEVMSLHGAWARERHVQRQPIGYGSFVTESVRGESGHQDNPFIAVMSADTTQDAGRVYAMNLVYSGNFMARVHKNQFDEVRMTMGIHPERFSWGLDGGDVFQVPEVVMQYSSSGLGGMTRSFHDMYRRHLIPERWTYENRPVLINNWEATYFDFDDNKLIDIAREAAKTGIEMLVMDDGWFGHRNSDDSSLGDWFVNESKITCGLDKLVQSVNELGMKFGIWFEPEMISPDSEIFRKHPEWVLRTADREPVLGRQQLILDYSNREVTRYVFECLCSILDSANIEYVKWDMNRALTDIGSAALPSDRQGELMHRHVLGVYELQRRITERYPDLLLENCSGGGARFDPGMLYYSPQIWCSDDTDAIERLQIQEGTMMVYPLSTIGAHVSDCPNHTNGRITPFKTRGDVAMAGTFGYELDITKISQEDRNEIPAQIAQYKKYRNVIQRGDYYRIASYSDNHSYDCYQVMSADKSFGFVTLVQVLAATNRRSMKVKLKGLTPDSYYEVNERRYLGSTLMHAGLIMAHPFGDFKSEVMEIREVSQ